MQVNKFYALVAEIIPPCYNQPDLFDPDLFLKQWPGQAPTDYQQRLVARNLAKKLCFECPIQIECLTVALEQRETAMIWGGYTPEEREQIRKGHKPSESNLKCL